jgi:polysaccharide pyruvyl transferase WcaK-like protein
MRILFDQAVYDLRNIGNDAMLQAAVSRMQKMWPAATLDVLTLSPNILKLYLPKSNPVKPDGSGDWMNQRWRYQFSHRIIPPIVWKWMFELRESINLHTTIQNLTKIQEEGASQPASDPPADPDTQKSDPLAFTDFASLVKGVDLYVSTGGQYMSDACRDDALRVLGRFEAAMNQGSVTAMVGQGLGPMTDPELIRRSKAILPKIDVICVRERVVASKLLAELGVDPSKVCITGDDALEMAYNARTSTIGHDIGVGLRIASYTQLNSHHFDVLKNTLRKASIKTNSQLISIPISHSAHEMDEYFIHQLISDAPYPFYNWHRFDSPETLIKKVGKCRVVAAGTFHAMVFALAQGIPTIGLAKSGMYVEKFLGLRDHFGDGCQIVILDDPNLEKNLLDAIDKAWNFAAEIRPTLLETTKKLFDTNWDAYHRIFNLVESHKSSR